MLTPEQMRTLFPKTAHWRMRQMMRAATESVASTTVGLWQLALSAFTPPKK